MKQRLEKYEAELLRLENILSEQERYASIKAQGGDGAESKFVNVDKTYKRIEWLENRIANIRNSIR